MAEAPDCAIIFDVDGVLLELADDEAELFFVPFARYLDASKLSRDWNSYRIRNDEDIVEEILEVSGLSSDLKPAIIRDYMNLLNRSLKSQVIQTVEVSGARELLAKLSDHAHLGIATANFREAARLRLEAASLWPFVSDLAFGADGGGHKSSILARAIAAINLPHRQIVYIGDNVNDVIAGRENGVHFIGFSTDPGRREAMRQAGAAHVTSSHAENLPLICKMLALET
jgi:HAD superfamily hydrolase (TIGR01549 family)